MAGDIQFDFVINSSATEQLTQRLRALDPANFVDIMLDVAALLGVKIEELVGDYPPQPPPRKPAARYSKKTGKKLKNRKAKRYKRTGRLGSSLTSEAQEIGSNIFRALIGSNVEYSPYVWALPSDNPGQAWFHKGVWTPLEEQINQVMPELRLFVFNELRRRVDAYLV
jgi:phage gpG-like protein